MPSFKYEKNPYDRDILQIKRDQVLQCLAFLEKKEQVLAQTLQANEKVAGSERDCDTLVNSNVKWLETATATLQRTESVTDAI